ncbi:MAG: hypothetical protein E6K76_03470 [Candidatus Eisenbacteria bacterium]|uniref:Uncharacterized protein n=1 Tax=Eiseniibacteriota bacterium TaxID=2212470 RepID=A0A538T824_UNCEI|nr:MAG: hypothetical protein E6K76_03470 [Candidatus Eisenbacteria bacterium]
MGPRSPDRRRVELPEILASILEARGAAVSRNGMIWEAALTPDLESSLGVDRVRLVASPAGRAARGAEMDSAMTERILLLGRSHGQVTCWVAPTPWPKGATPAPRIWTRLHWRIRYGSDEIPEELLVQELPLGSTGGMRAPRESLLRPPTAAELGSIPKPDLQALAATWTRAIRLLEGRTRRKLRPHEDRARRELHREMRTLSSHYRSLIAEERAGRARRPEDREAGRMLQLKEDWERKLVAVIRQRAFDAEATLVAAALLVAVPDRQSG